MAFARYDAFVIPRKLTAEERKQWRRKDGSERECLVVYNYHLSREIPACGERVAITSSEIQKTYARIERDGDAEIRMPSEPSPVVASRPLLDLHELEHGSTEDSEHTHRRGGKKKGNK